jgi:dTDP-4-dehydrorhamnose reductase
MKILMVGWQGMLGADLLKVFGPKHQLFTPSLEKLDITKPDQCRLWLDQCRPDAVICAAALTDVDYCESHAEEAFLVNGEGVGHLAKACAEANCPAVHYSTDYIFDGRKSEAYLEEDTPNPLGVYGKSKLLGEQLLREYLPEHLILRTSWLFGRNGKNFIRTVLNLARTNTQLRVVNDQRGSPTYTRDVAYCTERLLAAGCRGTYHTTNSGSCTWYELASKAIEWSGMQGVQVIPVSTSEFPRPAPRPANSVLANARLAREGFPMLQGWPLAVQQYLREMQ